MAARHAWFWRGYAAVYDLIWDGPLTRDVAGRIAGEVCAALELSEPVGLGAGDGRPVLFDIGCGTGLSSEPFSRRGWKVFGVDPVPDMLGRARDAGRIGEAVLAGAGGGEPMPSLPMADAVMLANVLQVHPDPARALDDAWRFVRPGGVLACAWPVEGLTLDGLYHADRAAGRSFVRSQLARILRFAVGVPGMLAGVRAHSGAAVARTADAWSRRADAVPISAGTVRAVTAYMLVCKRPPDVHALSIVEGS